MSAWSFARSASPLRPFAEASPRAQEAVWEAFRHEDGVMWRGDRVVHLDLAQPAARALLGGVTSAVGVTLGPRELASAKLMAEVAALAHRVPVGVMVERIEDLSPLAQLDAIVALDASYATRVPLAALPRLVALHLEHVDVRAARMREIAALPLEQLSLYYCNIASAEPVSGMRGLRLLRLHMLEHSSELQHVAGLVGLHHLEISAKRLVARDLEHLAALRDLTGLEIVVGSIDASRGPAPRGIGALAKLERLELACDAERAVRADVLGALDLPRLEELWLDGWPHPYRTMEQLGAPRLRWLVVIGEVGRVGDDALAWAPRFPALEHVMVPVKRGAALAPLRALPALRGLSTSGPFADLSALAGLPLERLRVDNTELDDAGAATLTTLTELRELDVGMTRVTDGIAPVLATLAKLEEINLYCDRVGDATFAALAQLPRLRVLNAGRTGATDAGVAHLAGNTSLRELDLSCAPITDAAMRTIGGLRGLQKLRLTDVETLTAAGFAEVLRLDNLRALYMPTPPDSAAVEAQLRQRFPRLWFDC